MAKTQLYSSGLAELDDLTPEELRALRRRMPREKVELERLEIAEDMARLLLRDLDADVPQDVRDGLDLCLLCLEEVRAGLGLKQRTVSILTPRPKRRRVVSAQTAEEADHGA